MRKLKINIVINTKIVGYTEVCKFYGGFFLSSVYIYVGGNFEEMINNEKHSRK